MAAVNPAGSVDDAIFRSPVPTHRAQADWDAIARHLTNELGRFLATDLRVDEQTVVDGTVLSCSVASRRTLAGPLELRYEGIIGLTSTSTGPYVNALLFVYTAGRRLTVEDDAGSFVECVYERFEGPAGRWRLTGWQRDVYGEFEDFAPAGADPDS